MDRIFFSSNNIVGRTISLMLSPSFLSFVPCPSWEKKKFQKTILHTHSIQTKNPQTETRRTFDILHDDSIPFANVQRIWQKNEFTQGGSSKLKTSLGKYTHTHTNMHHQQACGFTEECVERCSDVKDMSAGDYSNNSHTHTLLSTSFLRRLHS